MTDFFIKNISVKWRLIGFISFLLVLMVASGTGGILGMKSANNSLSIVYHHHVSPLKDLRDIDNLFQKEILGSAEKILYNGGNLSPAWDESLARAETAKQKLGSKWDDLLKKRSINIGNSQEMNWATLAGPLIEKTNDATSQLVAALKNREINKLDDLHDLLLVELSKDYTQKIDMFVQDGLNSTKAEYELSQQYYNKSLMLFGSAVSIGILISLVAGFILLQDITLSFARVKNVIEHMLKGDLTKRLDLKRHDEFGLLAEGFNQMSTYICDLVTKIQKSGIQVTSSITEIAATIRQQEVTANEHAATTSEIAASTTEIAATSANLTNTMKKVNSLTKNAAYASEEGHASLQSIDNTMSNMDKATAAIVEKLSILSEKAGNIAGVVKTIHKVADQTNLLSLNAAIEAEKAGEYGAGFAVVATEIRRLADQTAVATYDIEQMVQEVQSAISAGVMGIDKFAENVRTSVKDIRSSSEILGSAIEQVRVLMPQINTVNDGIEAQSLGAKQISEATNQLNDAAQQTAESIAQTSITIGQLQSAASALQEAVSIFRVK